VAGARILVVGRGGVAGRLGDALRRRGFSVRAVADCGAALESLATSPPCAVVVDPAHAGFAASEFREMLETEHPDVGLVEVPTSGRTPLDVSSLAAEVESAARSAAAAGADARGRAGPAIAGARADAVEGYTFEELTSRNDRMLELFDLIPRVAITDSAILIQGETGTGKELVAAAIHRQSRRREGPFFAVNCGSLTDTLLESELFGHEKGAFTGAVKRKEGCFEAASGGTLFLDELGTVSSAMQVKLLRVLERKELRRVGGSSLVAVDVRIVAATHADLDEAVANGTFREDLLYRLNVVPLTIPPLRERPEDVRILAELFCRTVAQKQGRPVEGFDRAATRALVEYAWPGNVRELQNVVERAVILAAGTTIGEKDLPERVRERGARKGVAGAIDAEDTLDGVLSRVTREVERDYLRRLLRKYRGNAGKSAEHAGLNRRTLYNKLRVHGIRREDFR
jgi:DNA-binding NtrC family response regulator